MPKNSKNEREKAKNGKNDNKSIFFQDFFSSETKYPKRRGLSNFNPHEILPNDNLALINFAALLQDVKLVTNWIEMGEEKSFAVRFQSNSSCEGGGEMAFYFFPIREGALDYEEVYF
jgi:hypothetical protein